ncbi:MAG TPA: YbgC/FadM family acyl-CoA thioesterase [bacterium]|nr:YbgC/FadM family acyl-CoA thioesterase [bacterium]
MENIYFIKRKVYYHNTDAEGVVYYGRYMEFLEEARTDFFSSMGMDLGKLRDDGIFFVVARVEIDYRKPASYFDDIKVSAQVEKLTASTIHFTQKIFKDTAVLVEAKVVIVCIGANFKPKRLPPFIVSAMRTEGTNL